MKTKAMAKTSLRNKVKINVNKNYKRVENNCLNNDYQSLLFLQRVNNLADYFQDK